MDIAERVKKLSEYFQDMSVHVSENGEQCIYVIVNFPPKWAIDTNKVNELYNVSVINNNGQYYFCSEISNGFDTVFDAIDYCVDKMKALEERFRLLNQKIEELKNIFMDENNSLERLYTLEFDYSLNNTVAKDYFLNKSSEDDDSKSKKEKNKKDKGN